MGGLLEYKRKIYANVVYFVLLYDIPVWAKEGTPLTSRIMPLTKVQRRVAVHIICGYRIISYAAAYLLSRIPPIDSFVRKS